MSIELFKPDEYFNMEAMNSRLSSANIDISKESQRVSELQTSTSTEIDSLKARTTELETELPKVKEHLDNVDAAQQATATTLSSTRGDLATAQAAGDSSFGFGQILINSTGMGYLKLPSNISSISSLKFYCSYMTKAV